METSDGQDGAHNYRFFRALIDIPSRRECNLMDKASSVSESGSSVLFFDS